MSEATIIQGGVTPPPIHEAVAAIKDSVGAVGKTSRNQDQGYDFRGVDAVVNAVAPVLNEHGVIISPVAAEAHHRDVQTSRGKPARECTVTVTYRWTGPAGDHLDTQVIGEAMDQGDKGAAKAMSVAYRICLLQTLNLPTHDRDPDHDTYERADVHATDATASPETALRSEIAELAESKGYDLPTVGADFTKVMNGADIRTATLATLAEYRDRFKGYADAAAE